MTSLWCVNTTGQWLTNKAVATDIANFSPLFPQFKAGDLKYLRFLIIFFHAIILGNHAGRSI